MNAETLITILQRIERQAGAALDADRVMQQIALKYCRDVARDVLAAAAIAKAKGEQP